MCRNVSNGFGSLLEVFWKSFGSLLEVTGKLLGSSEKLGKCSYMPSISVCSESCGAWRVWDIRVYSGGFGYIRVYSGGLGYIRVYSGGLGWIGVSDIIPTQFRHN
jgi:hypothetical protein